MNLKRGTPPETAPFTYKGLLLGTLQTLALVCLLAQFFIDNSTENIRCVVMAATSSTLMIQYLWRSDAMTTHPLSSLALLGFMASSQLVALISQTADLTPFTQYLRAPELTFTVLAVAHITAVASHFVYRHFQPLGGVTVFLTDKLLAPLNIHRIPTPPAVWSLGLVGLVGLVMGGGATGDVGGKFLAGLSFLVWLPFMLPLYRELVGESYTKIKVHMPFIVMWALVIAAYALGKNHRTLMLVGPVQLAIVFLVHRCRGSDLVPVTAIKRLAVAAALMVLIMPQVSDLLLAMQISREKRGTISQYEQLVDTFDVFMDKHRLEAERSDSFTNLHTMRYDETYLTNTALTRFTETKFHDNMLYFGSMLDEFDVKGLVDHQVARAIALLPQNFIDTLEIKVNKDSLTYSNGDYYAQRAAGSLLGSYVTGSMWADIYVLTGLWLPFTAAIIFVSVFIALDCLSRFGNGYFISPIALGSAYMIYLNGLTGESIVNKLALVTRGTLQPILLYAALLVAVAFALQLFGRRALVDIPESSAPQVPRNTLGSGVGG